MKLLLTTFIVLFSLYGFSQSESFHRRTYDTLIEVRNAEDNSVIASQHWIIRVTMDSNYFADIAADTNKRRPVIITFGGKGEVASIPVNLATDTPLLRNYGQEYAASNHVGGFNYGIQLGNGTHYPIWITALQPSQNIPARFVLSFMRTLKNIFHPKGGVFLGAGLSEGSWIIGTQMTYTPGGASTEAQGLWKCWVDLEGVGPDIQGSTTVTLPQALNTWVNAYHGRFFGLEGTGDSRNLYGQLANPMNTALAGSAYFSYQNYGGGSHCCWNLMYDPTQTNFRSIAPIVNTHLVANAQNSMGNYSVDPVLGTNIFQWMLRQTDTTLINGCAPIVSAGSDKAIQTPTSSVSTTGTVTYQCGNTPGSITWSQVSGPNTATISAPGNLTTNFTGLIVGTYVFKLTIVDNTGTSGSATMNVTVSNPVPPTVSAGGPYNVTLLASSVTLNGTASGNGGATISTVAWTYVSGPAGSNIVSPSSNSTIVNGLVTGTYVFKFTATDNNGNSSNSNATVTVASNPTSAQTQQLYTGEYVTPWIDSAGNARTLTSNLSLAGTGGVGTQGLPGLINTPGYTFIRLNTLLHGVIFGAVSDSSVWTSGGNNQGQCAQGTITATVTSLTKIALDSSGNPVHGMKIIQGFYVNNTSEGFYAVKQGAVTDTIFGAGDLEYGMAMNGTAGAVASRLYPLYWRTGHHIIEMAASKAYAILFDDGQVYTGGVNGVYSFLGYAGSGTQYRTPHQVTGFDDSIRHIVGGDVCGFIAQSKTGKLWGWGPHSGYLGNIADGAYTTPHDLTTDITSYILNGTTRTSITALSANSNSFHALGNDSTQWGWGDNGQGSIGNGVEVDLANYSTPWSVDPAQILVLPQTHPVQVTNKHNFIKIFSGCLFGFTHFSLDVFGQIYGNGRNKGAVLGDGVIECVGANGDISATYSNSWDRPYATPITPYALTSNIPASCPGCKTGKVTTFCSECTIPTTTLVARAGSNQNINSTSTSLDGTSSTSTGGKLTYYIWSQTSGPNTAIIDVTAAPKPNISGLIPGVYTFQLSVTDNGMNSNTSLVTITVGIPTTNCNCIPRKKFAKLKFLP